MHESLTKTSDIGVASPGGTWIGFYQASGLLYRLLRTSHVVPCQTCMYPMGRMAVDLLIRGRGLTGASQRFKSLASIHFLFCTRAIAVHSCAVVLG
jgi:hypothetical protein